MGAALGLEWAGEVVGRRRGREGVQAGRPRGRSGSGGYAEYAVSDYGRTIPLPAGFSFEQAAVLPVALHTLHNALVTQGRLKAGESVLIQGASSGVGLMGLQIAKMKGAKPVMGSATNDVRRARLKEFGADLAIDTRDEKWPDQVLEATGGKGVNLTVDMVSGPGVNQIMKATAVLGRIVNVGRLGGVKAEFDFDLHAMKRIDYIGVTFRTRTLDEVREIVRLMRADLWDAVTAGKLQAADRPHLPARRVRRRAGAHAGEPALRQDRAGDVNSSLSCPDLAQRHPGPLPSARDNPGFRSAHPGYGTVPDATIRPPTLHFGNVPGPLFSVLGKAQQEPPAKKRGRHEGRRVTAETAALVAPREAGPAPAARLAVVGRAAGRPHLPGDLSGRDAAARRADQHQSGGGRVRRLRPLADQFHHRPRQSERPPRARQFADRLRRRHAARRGDRADLLLGGGAHQHAVQALHRGGEHDPAVRAAAGRGRRVVDPRLAENRPAQHPDQVGRDRLPLRRLHDGRADRDLRHLLRALRLHVHRVRAAQHGPRAGGSGRDFRRDARCASCSP